MRHKNSLDTTHTIQYTFDGIENLSLLLLVHLFFVFAFILAVVVVVAVIIYVVLTLNRPSYTQRQQYVVNHHSSHCPLFPFQWYRFQQDTMPYHVLYVIESQISA